MTSTPARSTSSDNEYAPDFEAIVSTSGHDEGETVEPVEPGTLMRYYQEDGDPSPPENRLVSPGSPSERPYNPMDSEGIGQDAQRPDLGPPPSDFFASTYDTGETDDEFVSRSSSPASNRSFKRIRPEDTPPLTADDATWGEDPEVPIQYGKSEPPERYYAYPGNNPSNTSLPRRGPEHVFSSLEDYLERDSVLSPPVSRYASPPGRRHRSAPSEYYSRRSSWASNPQHDYYYRAPEMNDDQTSNNNYTRPIVIKNPYYGNSDDSIPRADRRSTSGQRYPDERSRSSRSRPRTPYYEETEDPKTTSGQQESQLLKDRLFTYSQRLQALTETVATLEARLAQSLESRETTVRDMVPENGHSAPTTLVGAEEDGPHPEDLAEKLGLAGSIQVKRNSEKLTATSEARKTNPVKSEDFVWEQPKSVVSQSESTCELANIDAIERWVDELGRQRSTILCPEGPRAQTIDTWSLQLRWL